MLPIHFLGLIFVFFLLFTILFLISIIVLIIAESMHKEKIADITKCFILWIIFPFILPFKAKKKGLINKQIYSWILVLLSPLIFFTYSFWCVIDYAKIPYQDSYDELLFTSKQEIATITEIVDFPEFEYINNTNNWNGSAIVDYKFVDSMDAKHLIAKIETKLIEKENIFWDTLNLTNPKDIEFFGSNRVYYFERGWNTSYMKKPKIENSSVQVKMMISERAFTIKYEGCNAWNLDYYSNPDSLSVLTSVNFPDYEIVDLYYYGDTIDPFWDAKLKLNKKPSQAFIQSLKTSKHWTKEDDGTYHFRTTDRGGVDLWEEIIVDPNSKFINLHVSTH